MVRRLLLLLPAVALALVVAVALARTSARIASEILASETREALAAAGLEWAAVDADGLRLVITGRAPDRAARTSLSRVAQAAVAGMAWPLDVAARLVDRTELAAPTPGARRAPAAAIELLVDEREVVITGRFASKKGRKAFHARLTALAAGRRVSDMTVVGARAAPGWGTALEVAARAAAKLSEGTVTAGIAQVAVRGGVSSAEDRAALASGLRAVAGAKVSLQLALGAPRPAVARFTFTASREPRGVLRAITCHARSASEARAILAHLAALGGVLPDGGCPVVLGGPERDWAKAVSAGLDALATLPAGSLRLDGERVQLEPEGAVEPSRATAARSRLARTLPRGFKLLPSSPVRAQPVEPRGAPPPGSSARLDVHWDGRHLTLEGTGGNPVLARTIALRVRAEVGGRPTITLDPSEPAPAGWMEAALAAAAAVTGLGSGEAEVAPKSITVKGTALDPLAAARTHRALAAAAPPGYAVHSAVKVDLPRAVARVPLAPARCAAVLNGILRATPLTFAKSEAVLTPESAPLLDRLAAVLEQCEGQVEIGGHTDNRGRAAFNQRLSQARAEAVLDALVRRGVPLARLRARGYGESRPVASNDSEAGRVLNRRIEFGVARCEEKDARC